VPRLELHDVSDVFAFASAIAERSGLSLGWHDREDLVAYLVSEAWILSERYERGDERYRSNFSGFATPLLRLRCTDWLRRKSGRTIWRFRNPDGSIRIHERPRAILVSLDVNDSDLDRLDETLTEGNGDCEADWDEAVRGFFANRDRQRIRDEYTLGIDPNRRTS